MRRCTILSVALLALAPAGARAQQAPDPGITRTIDRLFDAMKKADTAAVRGSFLAGGRVIPMPVAGAPTDKLTALSLDDFVKFTGANAPGSWVERAWNPLTAVSGTLGAVWFDYDIYRNGTLTQCGSNAVQLQRVNDEWKIVSMAFSARKTDCGSHPPPAM